MNEDLLQDLALYKKSREKAVSVAARSLIGLYREVGYPGSFMMGSSCVLKHNNTLVYIVHRI